MNLAVTVTLDGLVRALRQTEHTIRDRAGTPRPDPRELQEQPERGVAPEQQREGGR